MTVHKPLHSIVSILIITTVGRDAFWIPSVVHELIYNFAKLGVGYCFSMKGEFIICTCQRRMYNHPTWAQESYLFVIFRSYVSQFVRIACISLVPSCVPDTFLMFYVVFPIHHEYHESSISVWSASIALRQLITLRALGRMRLLCLQRWLAATV